MKHLSELAIILPIIVAIALWLLVPFTDETGKPTSCRLPWATSVCTQYLQEQQLKTLENMSNPVRGV